MIIVLGLAVGFVVIVFQMVALARIYRSWSWWVGAGTFLLLGVKQQYALVKLPAVIVQAQLKGVMIESMTTEQWVNVAWSYAVTAGFIWWLDWMRRDFEKVRESLAASG